MIGSQIFSRVRFNSLSRLNDFKIERKRTADSLKFSLLSKLSHKNNKSLNFASFINNCFNFVIANTGKIYKLRENIIHRDNMSQYSFSVTIWRENEVYVSKCPEIEVASAGNTPEEALTNLKEAIELWIENTKELGLLEDYIPALTSKTRFTSSIELEI